MSEPERTRWTDDRMDDLAGEVRELRGEMRTGFRELREELRAMRAETKEEMRELRGELYSMHRWTVNLWATTVLGFVALFVQVSLR